MTGALVFYQMTERQLLIYFANAVTKLSYGLYFAYFIFPPF